MCACSVTASKSHTVVWNRWVTAREVDQPGVAILDVFDVDREGLLGTCGCPRPVEDLVNVRRANEPVLVAVVTHVLLRDPWWRGWLVPEVHPVDRLLDFPFSVMGISTLDDHPLNLEPVSLVESLVGVGTSGRFGRGGVPRRASSRARISARAR